jgi:hypothetical protein
MPLSFFCSSGGLVVLNGILVGLNGRQGALQVCLPWLLQSDIAIFRELFVITP